MLSGRIEGGRESEEWSWIISGATFEVGKVGREVSVVGSMIVLG